MNALDVKNFRNEFGLTQMQLAEYIGTSVRAVQSWEQGTRNITESAIKLIDLYRLKHNVSQSENINENLSDSKIVDSQKGIPFYGKLPVSAGSMHLAQIFNNEVPTGYISIPGLSAIAFFPVVGFSFEPIIRPGDHIGVREIDRWDTLDPDKIYLIITLDDRMAKRIKYSGEDDGYIWCVSTNLKEFKVAKTEIKAIYHVVYCGRFI